LPIQQVTWGGEIMPEIWFVVHQKELWDIDNRLIGFWKEEQNDLIKVADYVIYYRAGYKKITGVFKVVQKGYNLNRDFFSPDIAGKPIYQSRLELVSNNIICQRPTTETSFSFFAEWRRNRFGGLGKQVFRATKDDLKFILIDPSIVKFRPLPDGFLKGRNTSILLSMH
jgi:hypothetical protein